MKKIDLIKLAIVGITAGLCISGQKPQQDHKEIAMTKCSKTTGDAEDMDTQQNSSRTGGSPDSNWGNQPNSNYNNGPNNGYNNNPNSNYNGGSGNKYNNPGGSSTNSPNSNSSKGEQESDNKGAAKKVVEGSSETKTTQKRMSAAQRVVQGIQN